MANYDTTITSTGFRVKDPKKFDDALCKWGVVKAGNYNWSGGLVHEKWNADEYCIFGSSGGLTVEDVNGEEEIWIPDLVKEHILPGTHMVFKDIYTYKCCHDESGAAAFIVTDKKIICSTLDKWIDKVIENL